MAILTATDALYMTLYRSCPSYLNKAEEAIMEAIKNGKTDTRIVLPPRPEDIYKGTSLESENLALICYQDCDDDNYGPSGKWFSDMAEVLEHPNEEWFLKEEMDPEAIKKVLESDAFKCMKAKALLASYLVKLGYKVTTDLTEFIDMNFLTISWV